MNTNEAPAHEIIDARLLASVSRDAASSLRRRRTHNFHQHEEPVQRLLNALQPGTYIPPHKHEGVERFEMYVILQGAVGCLFFDDSGEVVRTLRIDSRGPVRGIEVPGETWHTLVALEPDSVVLEIKEGPYDPTRAKPAIPGFPDELALLEGHAGTRALVEALLDDWARRIPPN